MGPLTGDEVVFKKLVDPLRWHHQAPLPILEILLAFIAVLAGLLYHHLHLVRMESIQHFKEEIPLWELVVPVGQVLNDIGPLIDLWINVLHGQPGPMRYCLCRDFRLSQAFLLSIKNGLQEDQLALGGFR